MHDSLTFSTFFRFFSISASDLSSGVFSKPSHLMRVLDSLYVDTGERASPHDYQ